MIRLSCAAVICFVHVAASAAEPAKFELLDGDRVVFLGNTLIEREQKYGYWELMLTMAWPERNVTFRNLGWSGDTVWGESRAGFGTQADGYKALVEQVNAAKPTVIFVGYGNVEAFAGETGLPRFIDGFNKLLDDLEKTKTRIVVLGPILQSEYHDGGPAVMRRDEIRVDNYNHNAESYADTLEAEAIHRGHSFVDFREISRVIHRPIADSPFLAQTTTVNGMDVTNYGYIAFAADIARQLGINEPMLPVVPSFATEKFEPLRSCIIKKNELFFHRWRPQNETYLFGFRKHEQGNNAKEVFAFDPLVAAEEKKIAELRTKLATELKETRDAK